LAVIFSERNECTRENPVKVEVGEGEHVMVLGVAVGSYVRTYISCSNITIVGKGKDKTTILGGFYVNGKQSVKIEQLAVTNHAGYGLFCKGTNVDVTECCFKKCKNNGMFVEEGANVTATRCDFMENGQEGVSCHGANTKARLIDCKIHHNGWAGLYAEDHAVVNLHGTITDIHSNKNFGIFATRNAKVSIRLPSQHNTTHDNAWDNQNQSEGGSIANINADGTFTHVEEVEIHDDY
jgi:hypothetical protein